MTAKFTDHTININNQELDDIGADAFHQLNVNNDIVRFLQQALKDGMNADASEFLKVSALDVITRNKVGMNK